MGPGRPCCGPSCSDILLEWGTAPPLYALYRCPSPPLFLSRSRPFPIRMDRPAAGRAGTRTSTHTHIHRAVSAGSPRRARRRRGRRPAIAPGPSVFEADELSGRWWERAMLARGRADGWLWRDCAQYEAAGGGGREKEGRRWGDRRVGGGGEGARGARWRGVGGGETLRGQREERE